MVDMYDDGLNYFHYTFLLPILTSVNMVNLLFQSDNTEVFKEYNELFTLLLSVLRIFVELAFLDGLQTINKGNFHKIGNILDNPLTFINSTWG